jgi:thiol-disulfide isomerase/thioredoxin
MRAARATPARLTALALALAACAGCSTGSGAASNPPAASPSGTPGAVTSTPPTSTPPPTTSGSAGPSPSPTTSAAASSTASSAATLPAALAFRATTVDGAAFAGAELAGKKTVLWFWAPWCTVCARAAAGVKDAATALGPDVRVVGVAGLSTDAADMRRFVDRGGLQALTNLADTTGDLYAWFGISQQDTFVLIGPDGTVSRHPAYSQDVDLVALAQKTFG